MSVKVSGSYVEGKSLLLDGAELINSTFKNCDFIYRGGDFPLIKGGKIIDCRFHLEGPESKNQELARALRSIGVK